MRVLELSDDEEAAAYCGKLLARWGADVVRVESPDRASPVEALDRYLNGGKRRVLLDRATSEGRERLDRLAAQSDVLITDVSPAQIDGLKLLDAGGAGAPRVRTSITPFGLSGPYRNWEATASTLLALGGYTCLSGDAGKTPLTVPGNYAYYQAGNYAYVATLAAHLRAEREPQAPPATVEVSVLEALAALHQFTFVMYTHSGRVRSRHGNRWENLHPTCLLPCADGWFAVNVLPQFWEPFALMLGRPDIVDDPRFATNPDRMEHADELDEIIIEAMADWPMERVLREGQESWRVPVGATSRACAACSTTLTCASGASGGRSPTAPGAPRARRSVSPARSCRTRRPPRRRARTPTRCWPFSSSESGRQSPGLERLPRRSRRPHTGRTPAARGRAHRRLDAHLVRPAGHARPR